MKVIDSSALIKYLTKEDNWEETKSYIRGAKTIALALTETGNALWKKVKKGELSLNDAREILINSKLITNIVDHSGYLEKSLEIAVENNIAFYDSIFITMAKEEKSDLITCDKVQAEAARKLGIVVIEI